MFILVVAASLTFALNPGPEPEPYGPVVDQQVVMKPIPAPTEAEAPQTVAPGTVRPASYGFSSQIGDHQGRNYACVDDACKTVSPVFNTRSPTQAETEPFGR